MIMAVSMKRIKFSSLLKNRWLNIWICSTLKIRAYKRWKISRIWVSPCNVFIQVLSYGFHLKIPMSMDILTLYRYNSPLISDMNLIQYPCYWYLGWYKYGKIKGDGELLYHIPVIVLMSNFSQFSLSYAWNSSIPILYIYYK